jgi:hypothetical protein
MDARIPEEPNMKDHICKLIELTGNLDHFHRGRR